MSLALQNDNCTTVQNMTHNAWHGLLNILYTRHISSIIYFSPEPRYWVMNNHVLYIYLRYWMKYTTLNLWLPRAIVIIICKRLNISIHVHMWKIWSIVYVSPGTMSLPSVNNKNIYPCIDIHGLLGKKNIYILYIYANTWKKLLVICDIPSAICYRSS